MTDFQEGDAAVLLVDHVEEWSEPATQTTRIIGHRAGTVGQIIDLRPGDEHCQWQADDGAQEPMTVLLSDLKMVEDR